MVTRTMWLVLVILMAASSLACQEMRDVSCGVAAFLDGSVQCGEPDAQAAPDSEAPADPAADPMTGDSSAAERQHTPPILTTNDRPCRCTIW